MSPFYFPDCIELSENDVSRISALLASRSSTEVQTVKDNKDWLIPQRKEEFEKS